MVEVNSLNYILMVPKGGKEILKLYRLYVESRCAWVESYNRAGRWLVDKPRQV